MREKTSIFSGKHKAEGSWVADLPKMAGRSIYERFLVCAKPEIRKTKKGDYFLTVELGDKTGRVKFRIWQVPEFEQAKALALFEPNKVYAVEATVGEYNGEPQLSWNWNNPLMRCWECQFDEDESKSDYFKKDFQLIKENATYTNPQDMIANIELHIKGVEHIGYRAILDYFFDDDDFLNKFKKWPAAQKYHHAYFSGLIEHVFEMLGAAFMLYYPGINADLLRTGIILHDIGKLKEYKLGMQIECDETAFLTGHMVIAVQMVDEAVSMHKIDISREDLQKLYHLILSHHGEVELGFGSAVSPKLPEAVALYHLDQLSAKVNGEYVRERATSNA